MRTFVLLSIFALPLVTCGIACASTSADIGKPVCSHYDDSPKSMEHSNKDAAAVAAIATTTGVTASTTPGAMATSKGGGTSSMGRSHAAPHWQTFLPGMFR